MIDIAAGMMNYTHTHTHTHVRIVTSQRSEVNVSQHVLLQYDYASHSKNIVIIYSGK